MQCLHFVPHAWHNDAKLSWNENSWQIYFLNACYAVDLIVNNFINVYVTGSSGKNFFDICRTSPIINPAAPSSHSLHFLLQCQHLKIQSDNRFIKPKPRPMFFNNSLHSCASQYRRKHLSLLLFHRNCKLLWMLEHVFKTCKQNSAETLAWFVLLFVSDALVSRRSIWCVRSLWMLQ